MKKILVVDDDKDVLEIVEFALTSKGFDVRIHSTSVNVVKVVKYYNPDLILLDVHLPDKLGTQICKELKEIYTIPIILLSAYGDHQKSLAQGSADAFIIKPFDIVELVNTINLLLK
jgi:DNA-binding response OmpR family regulator